eukprot:gnl/Dysnectes_brevis/1685_a1915_984.p1 GENE.gnl/Dysnectes_brevis/1685_a1915_984~~gnl/Dysnectes_brevis/1685_a1915_984.p1  ORF type:complete len:989 (-),score=391.77 gnl/Dysnectes_brevis/1685_a1915_984:137-2884(-)
MEDAMDILDAIKSSPISFGGRAIKVSLTGSKDDAKRRKRSGDPMTSKSFKSAPVTKVQRLGAIISKPIVKPAPEDKPAPTETPTPAPAPAAEKPASEPTTDAPKPKPTASEAPAPAPAAPKPKREWVKRVDPKRVYHTFAEFILTGFKIHPDPARLKKALQDLDHRIIIKTLTLTKTDLTDPWSDEEEAPVLPIAWLLLQLPLSETKRVYTGRYPHNNRTAEQIAAGKTGGATADKPAVTTPSATEQLLDILQTFKWDDKRVPGPPARIYSFIAPPKPKRVAVRRGRRAREDFIEYNSGTIILRNLPFSTRAIQLWKEVRSFGPILSVRVPQKQHNRNRLGAGFAFVKFADPASAHGSVAHAKVMIGGRTAVIDMAMSKKQFEGPPAPKAEPTPSEHPAPAPAPAPAPVDEGDLSDDDMSGDVDAPAPAPAPAPLPVIHLPDPSLSTPSRRMIHPSPPRGKKVTITPPSPTPPRRTAPAPSRRIAAASTVAPAAQPLPTITIPRAATTQGSPAHPKPARSAAETRRGRRATKKPKKNVPEVVTSASPGHARTSKVPAKVKKEKENKKTSRLRANSTAPTSSGAPAPATAPAPASSASPAVTVEAVAQKLAPTLRSQIEALIKGKLDPWMSDASARLAKYDALGPQLSAEIETQLSEHIAPAIQLLVGQVAQRAAARAAAEADGLRAEVETLRNEMLAQQRLHTRIVAEQQQMQAQMQTQMDPSSLSSFIGVVTQLKQRVETLEQQQESSTSMAAAAAATAGLSSPHVPPHGMMPFGSPYGMASPVPHGMGVAAMPSRGSGHSQLSELLSAAEQGPHALFRALSTCHPSEGLRSGCPRSMLGSLLSALCPMLSPQTAGLILPWLDQATRRIDLQGMRDLQPRLLQCSQALQRSGLVDTPVARNVASLLKLSEQMGM